MCYCHRVDQVEVEPALAITCRNSQEDRSVADVFELLQRVLRGDVPCVPVFEDRRESQLHQGLDVGDSLVFEKIVEALVVVHPFDHVRETGGLVRRVVRRVRIQQAVAFHVLSTA